MVSKLNPKSILALTATAGPPVIRDICHALSIPIPQGKIEGDEVDNGTKVLSCNRDNIDVVVEFTNSEEERLTKVRILSDINFSYMNHINPDTEFRVSLFHEIQLLKILRKPENLLKLDQDHAIEEQENYGRSNFNGKLSSGSVIIYVWRQKEAEVITEQLRAYDIEGGVVCYHGGMDSDTRSKSQNQVRPPQISLINSKLIFSVC